MNNKKKNIIILVITLIAVGVFLSIYNTISSKPKTTFTFNTVSENDIVSYPDTKFAVISDLHYYDNSLGTTGSAFESKLASDRKLLTDSADILNYAVTQILQKNVDFVLVSGDLTKDGELINHQKVSEAFSKLTDRGIKVYVVPGNHDINNPQSFKYEGDTTELVPSIDADKFAEIYKNCGYGNAIYRDSNSLSYVAEAKDNLWIVGIDTCKYQENKPGKEETVSGRISQSEEAWLNNVLEEANKKNKAVIVLEHHGIVEHWNGQSKLHPAFLVDDYKNVGKMLSSYNVKLAFTGHYHAQDITLGDFGDDGFLYDIETGSLVTAPSPIRYAEIKDNKISINSNFIIDKIHPETSFADNASKFVQNSVKSEAYKTLKKYKVNDNDAEKIANYVTTAFYAHYSGDENINNKPDFNTNNLTLWSRFIYSQEKYVIDGLWNDLPPKDNDVTLDLSKK